MPIDQTTHHRQKVQNPTWCVDNSPQDLGRRDRVGGFRQLRGPYNGSFQIAMLDTNYTHIRSLLTHKEGADQRSRARNFSGVQNLQVISLQNTTCTINCQRRFGIRHMTSRDRELTPEHKS